MNQNNKGIAVMVIILIVALLGGGFATYKIMQKFGPIKDNGKSDILPLVVGGDQDEHGCVGTPGYSWCEEKQKCLVVWEEECTTTVATTDGRKIYSNSERGFSLKYPLSWTHQEFNCNLNNLNGVAFCPMDNSLGEFNCEMNCSPNSKESPIYLYYRGFLSLSEEDLHLKNNKYLTVYREMVDSFTSTDAEKW